MKAFPLLLLPFAATAAEPVAPAVELEPVDPEPAWRVSVGFRAAPGIKTSAAVDARAAAAAAGTVLRPSGGSSSGKAEVLGTTTEGTTAAEAQKEAGWSEGRTYWEFDNGDYINLDDGANQSGETQNWHFQSADDFVDGAVRARTSYSGTTTTRTRETGGTSLRETWGDALRDGGSDETACGAEIRLDRTLWETEDFGLDLGAGWAWYGDVDAFSVRGRAYAAAQSVAGTETETTTKESGTVVTSIKQPEFQDPADYVNRDGSMGGALEDVNAPVVAAGYQAPVLTVEKDRFSTAVERNPPQTTVKTSGGASGASKTTSRTVDVQSDGTLSLQELRLGVRPFWKATRWLSLRGDVGFLAVYSELETETRLFRDGAPAATIRKDDDDWTFGGYAGLALDFAATDALVFSVGAEARFPHEKLHFDDGVVSGSVELAEWSAFASVGWRF